MNTRTWWGIIIALLVVIIVLAWFLFTTPAPAKETRATATTSITTTPTSTTAADSEPLSKSVLVSSPKANAIVAKEFTVSGRAPGRWYFEATFPIQVRDTSGNVVGRANANAQGDWMTTGPVAFKAIVHIDTYSGPATLILLRDNPSGLPENDDSVEVPIVIQ